MASAYGDRENHSWLCSGGSVLRRGGQKSDMNVLEALRVKRKGLVGATLKQEWQTDFILRADLDQLLWAAWRCRWIPSRLQPAWVEKDCCD